MIQTCIQNAFKWNQFSDYAEHGLDGKLKFLWNFQEIVFFNY